MRKCNRGRPAVRLTGRGWRASVLEHALEPDLEAVQVRRPEDIANAAIFLCQDESSYVTGQIIGVNGGRRT